MDRHESKLQNYKVKYEGKVFKTKLCGEFLVLRYDDNENIYIKFVTTGYEKKVTADYIRRGLIKDRLLPRVHGVGIIGDEVTKENGKFTKEYATWSGMLARLYSEATQKVNPTYKDCSVSDNFKYYPYFKEWCSKQVGFNQARWELDKDILVKGNKIYSEDTCCFVPREINGLFIKSNATRGEYPLGVSKVNENKYVVQLNRKGFGKYVGYETTPLRAFDLYKKAKEAHIKDVANKWKDCIDVRVYEALMSYEVNIDD